MASIQEKLTIRSSQREEIVDISEQVQRVVSGSRVAEGLACVYSPHTTSGITIQENADPDVRSDILEHLRRMVPHQAGFRHGEGNSDAHIKTCLVGPSQVVPIQGGRLVLGTWQAIFFCEFDGPRTRHVLVKVLEG
jgi:secondary thiamine-phosphate synthase enzyme